MAVKKRHFFHYESKLPEKVEYYSNLNMEVVTDAGYMHGKRVCNDFHKKN